MAENTRFDLKNCPFQKINQIHEVFIIFFTEVQGELLFSTIVNDDKSSFIYSKTDPALDCKNAPLAAGRTILELFNGLVSPKALEETEFSSLSTPLRQNFNWHDLWTHQDYYPWIKKFAYLDVIFDEIEHKIVYFFPLKGKLIDLDNFVKEKQFKFTLEFMNQKEIKFDNERDKAICKFFDFAEHIRKTQEFRQNPHKNGKSFYLYLDNRHHDITPDYPYIPSDCLYAGLYRKNFENWKVFNVGRLEFPDEETLKSTKAIFIPGSRSSSYHTDEWIQRLNDFIKRIYENTSIKMVGICFGAQIIAQTLGGSVDMMPGRKTNTHYYYHNVENLFFTEESKSNTIFKSLNKKGFKSLSIFEAHGDNIINPPNNSSIIASSKTCPVEVYLENNGRFLGLQGHPEYDVEYCALKGQTFLYHIGQFKFSFEECGNKIKKEITSNECNCEEWREIVYDFIKG